MRSCCYGESLEEGLVTLDDDCLDITWEEVDRYMTCLDCQSQVDVVLSAGAAVSRSSPQCVRFWIQRGIVTGERWININRAMSGALLLAGG